MNKSVASPTELLVAALNARSQARRTGREAAKAETSARAAFVRWLGPDKSRYSSEDALDAAMSYVEGTLSTNP